MEKVSIQASEEHLKKAMEKHVREKASKAGIEIVYLEGENIISENPKTGSKKVLKKSSRKLHM